MGMFGSCAYNNGKRGKLNRGHNTTKGTYTHTPACYYYIPYLNIRVCYMLVY